MRPIQSRPSQGRFGLPTLWTKQISNYSRLNLNMVQSSNKLRSLLRPAPPSPHHFFALPVSVVLHLSRKLLLSQQAHRTAPPTRYRGCGNNSPRTGRSKPTTLNTLKVEVAGASATVPSLCPDSIVALGATGSSPLCPIFFVISRDPYCCPSS
jgi:hypothetical protein